MNKKRNLVLPSFQLDDKTVKKTSEKIFASGLEMLLPHPHMGF